MATRSAIEWTAMTWNPVTGCSKVRPGCLNCYAERMSRRLHAMGAARYARGFELTTRADALDAPLHWKAPRKVFVNSMSDLFHKDVPQAFFEARAAMSTTCHMRERARPRATGATSPRHYPPPSGSPPPQWPSQRN
jgi:protein gp37